MLPADLNGRSSCLRVGFVLHSFMSGVRTVHVGSVSLFLAWYIE